MKARVKERLEGTCERPGWQGSGRLTGDSPGFSDLSQGRIKGKRAGTSPSSGPSRTPPDTHCSLELRAGLFSTLYSLSTSCCCQENPTRQGTRSAWNETQRARPRQGLSPIWASSQNHTASLTTFLRLPTETPKIK